LEQLQSQIPASPNGKIVLMGIKDDAANHQNLIDKAMSLGASGFLDKRLSIEEELCNLVKTYLPQ
jgi:hypothetical protein